MVLEVVVDHRVVHKAEESVPVVVHTLLLVPVVALRRFRQHEVEREVGELLLDGTEVVHVEQLALGSAAVEERHLPARLERVEQVEQVRTHGCHSCTAADVHHFRFRLLDEELAVRSGDGHLVAGLLVEHKRRANAWVDLHPAVARAVPRWRRNSDVEHHDVALSGVVGHRVRANNRLVVDHLEVPQPKLVPLRLEGVGVRVMLGVGRDVDVLVLHRRRGHVHLDVPSRFKVEGLALRQAHHKLLDEGRDVVVGHHFAFPLLDAKHFLRHLDLHVFLHLDLATEAPVVGNLLPRKVRRFRGENGAPTGVHLAPALHARATSAAGGWQEHPVVAQRGQKRGAAIHFKRLLPVDGDFEFARGRKFGLHEEEEAHEHQDDREEEGDGQNQRGRHV